MNHFYCAGCDRPIPLDCDDNGKCVCGETKVRLLPKKEGIVNTKHQDGGHLGGARVRRSECGKWTDAGPCPGCGVVVCQHCAETAGESCCCTHDNVLIGICPDCGEDVGRIA